MSVSSISPAFEPFLADSGPQDKREAIVVYRSPASTQPTVRGRMRALRRRLKEIEARASSQHRVQARVLRDYKKAGESRLLRGSDLAVQPMGKGLPVASVEVTSRTLSALAEDPDVVAVLPNQRIRLIRPKQIDYEDLGRQESKDGVTWGLKLLGIPEMWKTAKGKDINVAVLDTGVHGEHAALQDRVKKFMVIDRLGRRVTATPPFDADEHGTHVCGTIAGGKTPEGVSIGVAPEANLFVGGVIIGGATLRALIEGMSWAVESGADIISMSLGFDYYEPLFAEVFRILIEQYDVVPVVAVGNENHGNTSSPGNAPNAFSVGALEKLPRGKHEVASFSSGASLVFPGAQPDLVNKPDVVAPGVQVYSCIPLERNARGNFEFTYMNGTSMATPHVAGVAALLMSAKPSASAADIIQVLKDTAKHPSGAERRPDNRWGYGLIQPLAALQALG